MGYAKVCPGEHCWYLNSDYHQHTYKLAIFDVNISLLDKNLCIEYRVIEVASGLVEANKLKWCWLKAFNIRLVKLTIEIYQIRNFQLSTFSFQITI